MERTKKRVSARLLLRASTLEPEFQNALSIHRQSANLFTYADDHQIYTNDNDTTTTTTMSFICMAIKESYSIAKAF